MSVHKRMTWMSALAAVAVLFASSAEARFGKKSTKASKSSSSSSSSSSGRSSGSSGGTHEASAVGQPRLNNSTGTSRGASQGFVGGSDYHYHPSFFGWGYGYQPMYGYPSTTVVNAAPASATQTDAQPVKASLSGGLLLFGAASGGGGAGIDLGMMFEGERLGVAGTFSGLAISADDGSGGTDSIKLLNGFMTYSMISRPEGRLRVEGGVMSAFAPDLIVAGPALGFSGAMGLFGPVGLDASVRMTAFPYRQVDAQAGLTLGIGPLGLRAGMRSIYLNDAGLLGGEPNTDTFVGPYGGMELVF